MIPIPIIIAFFPLVFHIILGWALMSAVLNGQKLTWAYERRLKIVAMPMVLFCMLAMVASYLFTEDLGYTWLRILISMLWIIPYGMAWVILTNYKNRNRIRHKLLQLIVGFGFVISSVFFILGSLFVAVFDRFD